MNGACNSNFFGPAPWGGVKRSNIIYIIYHIISITKSISKIFMPNFVCVLTNERYKIYQTGFSFCHMGHAPQGWDFGALGGQIFFFFKHGHVAY